MRAVLYTRVSSDPNGRGRSVAEQEAECRATAEREGWDVVEVFCDNDRSASRYAKKARPAYAQLVQFVTAGGCDVLVTWEASRFQRDLEDYVSLRELCRSRGVLWSYSGRTYDLSRTDDRLSTGLDALLAERESDLTRDRILRSVRSNAAKGRPHGRTPYGYVRQYDTKTGELVAQVIREDEAAVIREAARRFLAGETTWAIAADFNARGIPTPRSGRWDYTRIRRLLTSPTVAGQRVYQGKVTGPADWPAILDEATFARCGARLDDPARNTTDSRAVKYLLSGIATCGVCGAKLKVAAPHGSNVYLCKRGFCVVRVVGPVDALVTKAIIARLDMPDALALLTPQRDDDTGALLEAAADKRARLDAFYDAAANGEITAKALGRIEARLLAEIEALERQVRRAEVPAYLYDLVGHAAAKWDALHLSQKRETIRLLAEVSLLRTRRGARTLDPASVRVRWRRFGEAAPPARS